MLPYADRPGVYLIMDDKDNVLYIGKSSVAIGICYDGEGKCRVRNPYWSTSPKYIVAIAVPFDSAFECAASNIRMLLIRMKIALVLKMLRKE